MNKTFKIDDYTGKTEGNIMNIKIIEGKTAIDAVRNIYGKNVRRAKSYECPDVIIQEVTTKGNGEIKGICGNMLCYMIG